MAGRELKDELNRKRARLLARLARLREAFLSGADSAQEYKSAKLALQEELNKTEKSLAALTDNELTKKENDPLRAAVEDALSDLFAGGVTAEQMHAAVCSIIESCTWDKSQNLLKIQYRSVE